MPEIFPMYHCYYRSTSRFITALKEKVEVKTRQFFFNNFLVAVRLINDDVFLNNYRVAGPQSLWHIDGHHALIRWSLVTHGGIDGYSRMIVFLRCGNNNRSETVSQLFSEASQRYGLPSRVRADR